MIDRVEAPAVIEAGLSTIDDQDPIFVPPYALPDEPAVCQSRRRGRRDRYSLSQGGWRVSACGRRLPWLLPEPVPTLSGPLPGTSLQSPVRGALDPPALACCRYPADDALVVRFAQYVNAKRFQHGTAVCLGRNIRGHSAVNDHRVLQQRPFDIFAIQSYAQGRRPLLCLVQKSIALASVLNLDIIEMDGSLAGHHRYAYTAAAT